MEEAAGWSQAAVARQLGLSVRSTRGWLSAWAEVVGPVEEAGQHGPPAYPRTVEDLDVLHLATEAFEENWGRLDRREALRRAAVFLGLSLPRPPSPPE